jgi:hypothetical protein
MSSYLLDTTVGCVIGGLIVAGLQELSSHLSKDTTVQIADEITRQLNQRSVLDAQNLHNQIATETAKQLEPFHREFETINQDIGRIKDRLHIAKNTPPTNVPEGFRRFAPMNLERFAASLPVLNAELKAATLKQSRPDPETLKILTEKLRHTSETAPEYWPTVLRFISFASVSAKNVPPEGQPNLTVANNNGFMSLGTVQNKIVSLDGGDLGPTRFEHCRIIFTEHQVLMRGVEFVECVFQMPSTTSPNDYLKKSARQLLASNRTKIEST